MADDTISDDGSANDAVTPTGVTSTFPRIVPASALDLGEAKFQGVFKHVPMGALGAAGSVAASSSSRSEELAPSQPPTSWGYRTR